MQITVRQDDLTALADHARVSTRFLVRTRFEIERVADAPGGLVFREVAVDPPWEKDYDDLEPPAAWGRQWDLSGWGLIGAFSAERRLGGCVIAYRTPGLHMLEGRDDQAALWDIRIDPAHRGRGIGARLFQAAESWARDRGCRELLVETQDINVPACRFYARMGCVLRSVDLQAYPALPGEARLIWSRKLDP